MLMPDFIADTGHTMSSTDDTEFSRSTAPGNAYWADEAGSPAASGEEPVVTTTPGTKKQGSVIREVIETALIAVLIFVGVRTLVLNFRVDGSSMLPSLVNGEMLLVNRNSYTSWDLY